MSFKMLKPAVLILSNLSFIHRWGEENTFSALPTPNHVSSFEWISHWPEPVEYIEVKQKPQPSLPLLKSPSRGLSLQQTLTPGAELVASASSEISTTSKCSPKVSSTKGCLHLIWSIYLSYEGPWSPLREPTAPLRTVQDWWVPCQPQPVVGPCTSAELCPPVIALQFSSGVFNQCKSIPELPYFCS